MIFTEEQIREIRRRLAQIGVRDTDLPDAGEIMGEETIAIVQEGINKKIPLSQVFESPAFSHYYKLLLDTIKAKQEELDALINEIKEQKLSLSDQLGDGQAVGITQKVITDIINSIWDKIDEITGQGARELVMTITPPAYVGEDGCDVHIKAECKDASKVFEKVSLYLNDVLVSEAENTSILIYDTHINEDATVRCEAQIMGRSYHVEDTIRQYNSFYIGAGTNYTDIMDTSHSIKINESMRESKDITCSEGDNIFVVINKNLRYGFIRIDMNGFEIPFTESTEVVDNTEYSVFTSNNTYRAGTYNIDING